MPGFEALTDRNRHGPMNTCRWRPFLRRNRHRPVKFPAREASSTRIGTAHKEDNRGILGGRVIYTALEFLRESVTAVTWNRHRPLLEGTETAQVTEFGSFRHRHKSLRSSWARIIGNRQNPRIFRGFLHRPTFIRGGVTPVTRNRHRPMNRRRILVKGNVESWWEDGFDSAPHSYARSAAW
jgi:hypothetical protein